MDLEAQKMTEIWQALNQLVHIGFMVILLASCATMAALLMLAFCLYGRERNQARKRIEALRND